MENVCPIFDDLCSTGNKPIFYVNFNGDVLYCNNRMKEVLNILEDEHQKIELDEHSNTSWLSFLNNIREKNHGTCILNIKQSDCKFKKVQVEGHLYKRKDIICVHVLKIISTNFNNFKRSIESAILDDIQHGVLLTDVKGSILRINKKALKLFQCEYHEIINKPYQIFFSQFEDFQYRKQDFNKEIKEIGHSSIILRSTNGKEYYRIESKRNNKANVIVSTITDVTSEYALQNNLVKYDVEKEISQITACIAHEIRNPMTALKGFIELIKQNIPNSNSCERYLNIMESELNRINDILQEILNSSKSFKDNFEKVNLMKVVNDVVEVMTPGAIKKHIIFTIQHQNLDDNTVISGNVHRLKQVLINLIKNAIEVMDNGGVITITLHNKENGFVQLAIQDEGSGIPKEQLECLFKPFYTTKPDGNGLGLAVVKNIMEEHQGRISVKSEPKIGTTFYLEFPLYEHNKTFETKRNNFVLNTL